MNPDNNPYPIDYLNQIAPEPKKPGMNNRLFVVIIGIGGILAIIVGLLMLLNSGASTGPKASMQRLAARMQTLQTISDKSQKTIKSSALRGTNSNLNIFLTNANRDIVEPLANNGLEVKKLDKAIVASETGDELSATLEDARLNALFDNTYAREMSFQLATVDALMGDIYEKTNSESMKEFLVNTADNLEPIKKQFDDFNSTDT